jgi:site-specific DNA recombinase
LTIVFSLLYAAGEPTGSPDKPRQSNEQRVGSGSRPGGAREYSTPGTATPGRSSVDAEDLNRGPPMKTANSPTNTTSFSDVEQLLGIDTRAPEKTSVDLAQAVVYLRVSTPPQMHTASYIDKDGNSIATQRVETLRKVRGLKATISREFVESGQSAHTISKCAEFKKMMRYIDEHRLPKLHRCRYHEARAPRKGCAPDLGQGRVRRRLYGRCNGAITDVMNEVQVRMNGEDVRVKMAHKVDQGGSIGRAKLGYLNVRKEFSGQLVNTIDIDPDRAPLVRWAFEQYAMGRHSVAQLTDMLIDQGLTMRPSPSRPARPINKSSLPKNPPRPVLHRNNSLQTTPLHRQARADRHEGTFRQGADNTQLDIKHFHYLRGHLVCGACHAAGRLSRLVYSQNCGNDGTYEYYTCGARNRVGCPTTGFRIEDIEDEIANKLKLIRIDAEVIVTLRQLPTTTLQSMIDADADAKSTLQREFDDLGAQEERLVELAADGTIATPKLRERLEQVALRKRVIAEKLEQSVERINYGAVTALAYLELLRDPAEIFRNAEDHIRRELLGVSYIRTRV